MPKSDKAKKVLASFKDQYGDEAGERVFYATANKQNRDPDTWEKNNGKGDKSFSKAAKQIDKKGTEGKFTEYCKRIGYDGVTDDCIKKGQASDDETTRRRANFAKASRTIAKGKGDKMAEDKNKSKSGNAKVYTVGKNVEIVSKGEKYLLEKGDKIRIIPKESK